MKYIKWILGYVFAIGLLCILLVGSIRVTVYHNEDYFRQEYEKYQVHKAVDMEMDDLISMTTEMMEYLMGSREDLNIITTIGGEEKEFFNDSGCKKSSAAGINCYESLNCCCNCNCRCLYMAKMESFACFFQSHTSGYRRCFCDNSRIGCHYFYGF